MAEEFRGVNTVYNEIFAKDPLLLDEGHQRAFGEQILRNLLVERAVKTSLPRSVTLSSESSRNEFKRQEAPPADGPKSAVQNQYFDSLRMREPLDSKTIESLKPITMVSDAKHTAERATKTKYLEDHERAEKMCDKTESPLQSRLRFAAIGYRVSISKIPGGGFLDEELCPILPAPHRISLTEYPENKSTQKLRRTKLRELTKQPSWFAIIIDHIKHALNKGSHIVLLPEFGLPPNVSKTAVEEAISLVADKFKHPFFLFSGTRHEGIHNRGFVLTRNTSETIGREEKEDKRRWWHYKTASARGLGENIMGPQNAKAPSYRFSLPSPLGNDDVLEYRVFVAICYDVFDPTAFINYVIGCADAQGRWHESIILVPSFNPAQEFVHALRDLSFIAECPVMYVNGLHGDAKLFLYGIDVTDLLEIERNSAEGAGGEQTSRIEKSIGAMSAALRTEQRNVRAELDGLEEALIPNDLFGAVDLRKDQLRNRLKQIVVKIDALNVLHSDLNHMRAKGALKYLITVERCDDCAKPGHGGAAYCANDILYYNLDPELLEILKRFRQNYFLDDAFLPSPFRKKETDKVRELIDKIKEQRPRVRASPR